MFIFPFERFEYTPPGSQKFDISCFATTILVPVRAKGYYEVTDT